MRDHPFKHKLGKKKVKFVQKMLTMVEHYILLEEKLTVCFDNLTFIDRIPIA